MQHSGPWHMLAACPLALRRRAVQAVCCPAVSAQSWTTRRAAALCCAHRCFTSSRTVAAVKTAKAAGKKEPKTKKSRSPSGRPPSGQTPRSSYLQPTPSSRDDVVRSLSFLPPPEAEADVDALVAPPPSAAALDRATALFLHPPPRFLYSAPRFLNLPINSRMPEICILGRSNVGKSTLLNALAGLVSGGKAGRSHGAKPGRLGLAITSARAGCTKMMNGYGFGPPLKGTEGVHVDPVASAKPPSAAGTSRSQRRARPAGEPSPANSLVLLDMPGYGYLSRSEWGAEITKYLQRRTALRGAVLLVDAVAGLKEGDHQVLAMLRDANVRTLVVLTKADKLVGAGDEQLRNICRRVWETLRKTECHSWGEVPWMEGQGWDRAIYVTGAGDPKGGGLGVAGTRLAICRMAGLLPKERMASTENREGKKNKKNKSKADVLALATPPKVVPFDQIQWAETSTEVVLDQADEHRMIAEMEAVKKNPVEEAAPKRTSGRIRPWRRQKA